MKKNTIFLIISAVVAIAVGLIILGYTIKRRNYSRNCRDIIGDGYAMGSDRNPVVIGNTCD